MCEFRAGEKLPEEANLTVFVIDHFKPEFSKKTLYHLRASGPSDMHILCISVRMLSVLDRMEEPSEQCETLRRTQGLWTGWGPGTSRGCVFCFLITVLAAQAPFSGNIFHSSPKRKEKNLWENHKCRFRELLAQGRAGRRTALERSTVGSLTLPSRVLVGCPAPWNSSCYAS